MLAGVCDVLGILVSTFILTISGPGILVIQAAFFSIFDILALLSDNDASTLNRNNSVRTNRTGNASKSVARTTKVLYAPQDRFWLSLCCIPIAFLLEQLRTSAHRQRATDAFARFVTTHRGVWRIMGYDPANPATWSIAQLRHYATEHHITIPSGCEKAELAQLVDDCLTDELLAEHIRSEQKLDTAPLTDLLGTSPEVILRHAAYPAYAAVLRRHPEKLQAIIDEGLVQLQSLGFVARLCSAQLSSPLDSWLGHVAVGEDGGTVLRAALTPVEDRAVPGSVCGRFCSSGEMVVRCLDCGADSTCVMCMDCFRHSPCVHHRYRITQGSGGGMCDCGDPTAWKPASFCSRHRAVQPGEDSADAADPLVAIAEEDRVWVVAVLRGVVQLISLTLLQHQRIAALRKRAKRLSSTAPTTTSHPDASSLRVAVGGSGTRTQASMSTSTSTLLADIARIPETVDWLARWLESPTEKLWRLLSETTLGKQVVAQLWAEPLRIHRANMALSPTQSVSVYENEEETSSTDPRQPTLPAVLDANSLRDPVLDALPDPVTCLHPVFLYEVSRAVLADEQQVSSGSPETWRNSLARCIGHCLSDAKLRLPVGALMATYAECINAQDLSTDNEHPLFQFQVQVLTNPDVIQHLMSAASFPYKHATNTVVHRELSSLFYTLAMAVDKADRNPVTATVDVANDGLIFLRHQYEHLSLASVTALQYCINGCPAAAYTLVMNRLAWRAYAQLMGSLAISGYIRVDPSAGSGSTRFPTPDFYARILARHTWLWFHAIRTVLTALLRTPSKPNNSGSVQTDTIRGMPAINYSSVSDALKLKPSIWEVWRRATRFDAPPDVSRRRLIFTQMLDCCRVRNGNEEALLLLQEGELANAQAAAIRHHLKEEKREAAEDAGEGEEEEGVSAPPQDAGIVTAIGYAVQVLYEVSRTMDVFFQKQRDGFCQGCHSIALEREVHDGVAALRLAAETSTTVATEDQPSSAVQVDVFEYHLLDPSRHAATFSNHLPHLFGTMLTAWVMELQRSSSGHKPPSPSSVTAEAKTARRLTGLPGPLTTSSDASLARPLRSLLDCFFRLRASICPVHERNRLSFCQQLLDSLVMPQVLMGQVLDGLWRRDDYDVSTALSMYVGFSRSVAAEFDILMLQVLTMELPPADLAIHILRRFTYTKRPRASVAAAATASPLSPHGRHRHPSFRRYLKSYKYYLRLMLTLIVDATKAAFHPPLSSACIGRTVAHLLAHKKMSHSTIVSSVGEAVRGGDFGDAEEDEKDANGNVIKVTQVIDQAVKRLAVAHNSANGKQFRLRDPTIWCANVSLYHSSMMDGSLEAIYENYRSVVLLSRSEAAATSGGRAAGGGGAGRDSREQIALPPTELAGGDAEMYAELVPTTRALLHTDAVLLPALYVLHTFACAHAPTTTKGGAAAAAAARAEDAGSSPQSRSSVQTESTAEIESVQGEAMSSTQGSMGDDVAGDEEEEDEDEDTNLITREALLHAVTALYLCVQDCRGITAAMQAAAGVEAQSPTAAATGAISWDLVEAYLQRYRVNELSFTQASCAAVLPLPELRAPRTLLQKLQTSVSVFRSHSTGVAAAHVTRSSAAMLHELRSYLLTNKDTDVYSCRVMVEEVLLLTGLATFDTAAAVAEAEAKAEAALSRKRLIQERQAKLMQRMRSRALKTASGGDSSDSAVAPSGTGNAEANPAFLSPHSPSAAEGRALPEQQSQQQQNATHGGSLLTKLLLELATVDCCVCRSTTEEPLFLLCHTSTSAVLPQLGALVLPDGRHVHSHLRVCGHAAHKTCVEKLFVRLSVLWQRWNFRSQYYLGPTELNCPLCNMIVTTIAPVPALGAGAAAAASAGSPTAVLNTSALSASLFEELQGGTAGPASKRERTEGVIAEFLTNLANSAVGFSPSEDIPAVVSTEDALQKDRESAWVLSEAMRTFFYATHLLLEGVKVGQAITHRELLALLSLLVSVAPAKLQQEHEALHANYVRTGCDAEGLLLMEALLKPRDAARLLRQHVLTHVLPALSSGYVQALLTCAQQDGEEAAVALEAQFPEVSIRAWKALGILALLKALLVEDASHALILRAESFTVAGTVAFTTLDVASTQTPTARCTAIVRLLQYLLPVPHKDVGDALPLVAQAVLGLVATSEAPGATVMAGGSGAVTPTLPYTTAGAYVQSIAEVLLHLPPVYATLLTALAAHKKCCVCNTEPQNPVLCCCCGRYLCMRSRTTEGPPELYQHIRECCGAVGLFLSIREGSFFVMELTSGRVYRVPSNFTDEYGERDRYLRRGVPLFRDQEETQKLVLVWMENKWGAVSSIFSTSNRMDLVNL